MALISKEEVKKIARISAIEINESEIESFTKQLGDVLAYAARVQEIAAELEEPSSKNINMFREDVMGEFDTEAILERAPEREDDFFVVPSIIEDK
ncbi:MAG: Asp-tRNA(Asn)/Glu-tRNA(Gln) amidotransferase subunit GatC [Candidatus Dependentiae bacterium]